MLMICLSGECINVYYKNGSKMGFYDNANILQGTGSSVVFGWVLR